MRAKKDLYSYKSNDCQFHVYRGGLHVGTCSASINIKAMMLCPVQKLDLPVGFGPFCCMEEMISHLNSTDPFKEYMKPNIYSYKMVDGKYLVYRKNQHIGNVSEDDPNSDLRLFPIKNLVGRQWYGPYDCMTDMIADLNTKDPFEDQNVE